MVLETHSEHIVNAIRVLSAESKMEPESCAVFLFESSSAVPTVHRLEIGEDGTTELWPRNFFGEAAGLRARLLRAQSRFRDSGIKL